MKSDIEFKFYRALQVRGVRGLTNLVIADKRRNPFVIVSKRIFLDECITKSSDISVYCVLSAHAGNTTHQSWASIATIAKEARCSESSVRRALKTLRNLGYIEISERYDTLGRQTSNKYTLLDV